MAPISAAMVANRVRRQFATGTVVVALLLGLCPAASGNSLAALPDTIETIRPSVVGIGTYQRTRSPSAKLQATGFAIADGHHVVTNAHALADSLDRDRGEYQSVFAGRGREAQVRRASVIGVDKDADLAILRIKGKPLEPLTLGNAAAVREGERIAFTGYPIVMVLGLYPATHQGIVAAITPLAAPARRSGELDARDVRRLRGDPPGVFQLDATAYPGNSGSPLYDPETGDVVGIINRVYVQGSREEILSEPSGISYAIPISLLDALLEEAGLR